VSVPSRLCLAGDLVRSAKAGGEVTRQCSEARVPTIKGYLRQTASAFGQGRVSQYPGTVGVPERYPPSERGSGYARTQTGILVESEHEAMCTIATLLQLQLQRGSLLAVSHVTYHANRG